MEDDPLWKALKKGVRPLQDDHYVKDPIVEKPKKKSSIKSKNQSVCIPEVSSRSKPYQEPPLVLGEHSKRVDRATDIKIKKGKMSYEAKLDFHGMTVEQAYRRFGFFLENAVRAKKKLVLVITGKGEILKGGGIIRQSFQRWVNEPVFSKHILSCHQAQPKDGGGGAFYVYLRG